MDFHRQEGILLIEYNCNTETGRPCLRGDAQQFDDITMLCLDYFGPEQKERDSEAEDETRA